MSRGQEATDAGVRARVAGREAVARRTVWQLDIGAFRVRCVASPVERDDNGEPIKPASAYVVQNRDPKNGWTNMVGAGDDPAELLRRLVGSAGVAEFIQGMIKPAHLRGP